jgi:uncharacterized RmlC-like cupin family protein
MPDAFHPDLRERTATPEARTRVHRIRAADLSGDTAQTTGMRRLEALSGRTVGSRKLWTGEAETSICVVSGSPRFVFHDGAGEVVLQTEPGDYVVVPPYVPHRAENPDPDNPAVVVISRSTQEGIVVNLPALTPLAYPS